MVRMKRYISIMLMVAGITIGVTSSAHAVVIDFQNSVQSVPFGSTVSMELRYSSLPDYLSPASFDIEVGFNSTILGFSGVTFGDPVNGDQLNPDGLAYQEVLGPYDLATPGFSAVNLVETASSLPAVSWASSCWQRSHFRPLQQVQLTSG